MSENQYPNVKQSESSTRGTSINRFVYVVSFSEVPGLKRTEDVLSKQLIRNQMARFAELKGSSLHLRKNIPVRPSRDSSNRMNCCIKCCVVLCLPLSHSKQEENIDFLVLATSPTSSHHKY